jgi:hypothetical protein
MSLSDKMKKLQAQKQQAIAAPPLLPPVLPKIGLKDKETVESLGESRSSPQKLLEPPKALQRGDETSETESQSKSVSKQTTKKPRNKTTIVEKTSPETSETKSQSHEVLALETKFVELNNLVINGQNTTLELTSRLESLTVQVAKLHQELYMAQIPPADIPISAVLAPHPTFMDFYIKKEDAEALIAPLITGSGQRGEFEGWVTHNYASKPRPSTVKTLAAIFNDIIQLRFTTFNAKEKTGGAHP